MKKQNIINIKGEKVKDLVLSEQVWGIEPNDAVLYDAITLSRNNQRQGTASTKTRSEVSGGGKKPWRQKGTGRARQGSIRSPQWPGGGIVFGPHPRSYSKKMNRKERRLALKSALAYKIKNNELLVLDSLNLETNKTKEFLNILKNLEVGKNVLILINDLNDNIILATRNIKNITLLETKEVNTYDVMLANTMIVTEESLKLLEEVLK